MNIEHLKEFVKRHYRRPACKVSPVERRFLMMRVLLFFCMQRFSYIQDQLVGDVRKMEGGDLEVYVRWSKKIQLGYRPDFYLYG